MRYQLINGSSVIVLTLSCEPLPNKPIYSINGIMVTVCPSTDIVMYTLAIELLLP